MDTTFKNIPYRKLYRSRNAQIAGVCAGIADYYDLDALVVRILAILLLLTTFGLASIVYFVLWAHLPLAPERLGPYDASFESAELAGHKNVDYYVLPDRALEKQRAKLPIRGLSITTRIAIIVALVLIYLVIAMNLAPLIKGTFWWQFWPLFLFIIGLFFLVVPIRSRFVVVWHMGGLVLTILSIALLPMSLDVLSWRTLSYAFSLFGPIFIVACILFAVGIWAHSSMITIAGTCCFLLFCMCGIIYCVLPGSLEATSIPFQILSTPTIPLLLD